MLKSMTLLCKRLTDAVSGSETISNKYDRICNTLTEYQEQSPLYYKLALSEINIDFTRPDCLPSEKETFDVGEEINRALAAWIHEGIQTGGLKPDIPVLQTVFLFWSCLSGLIQTAASKQTYIEQTMHLTKREFLEFGFDRLYGMIESKETL